jgi:hypothetical protein
MTFRFKIGDFLAVTFLVALFVGFYAPELRSLDRNARVVFVASAVIIAVSLFCFTPVWIVLWRLRGRIRRGFTVGAIDLLVVAFAFVWGLRNIVAVLLAVRWLVVR